MIKPRRGNKKTYEKLKNNEKEKIKNCVNCGAPLHGKKCEYCDTEY